VKLELLDLCKNYGKNVAVRPLNLTLRPGIYGFLGPNGAGKTTLMNMLADCLSPTGGNILCDGKSIWDLGAKYRMRIGYLPQNVGMYRHFSGREMLSYFASLKGIKDRGEARREIEDLLEKVNLHSEGHKKVGKYSGGMKRRLGIAGALLGNPELLIFDEPTAGLDPKERLRFKSMLTELASSRIIILATHIVSDIEDLAHRILLIKEGLLLGDGTLKEHLKSLDEKMWTTTIPASETETLKSRLDVFSVKYDGSFAVARVYSEKVPIDGAKRAIPTLDDLYMYHFGNIIGGSRGRSGGNEIGDIHAK